MYYAQTPSDQILLENFKDVVNKYNSLVVDGLIIFPKNALYPRLSISHARGKRAALQLINTLCKNLIPDPPPTILHDIRKAEFDYDDTYDILTSKRYVSFMTLHHKVPKYKVMGFDIPDEIQFYDDE